MGHGDVHSNFADSKPNQAAVITKVNPTPSPSKMSAKEIRMKSCRYHANDLKMFMICLLGYLYCTSPCCKPYSWPQCKPAHNALETPTRTPETTSLPQHVPLGCHTKRRVQSGGSTERCAYLVDEEYLVTAFVPSETACLASSPGRISRTLVYS